jgi:DNA-binding SARP family transcriptional activator
VAKPIKISLLGGFRACREDGEPVIFSSRKAQALIAYLALEADRPQSREKLASLLWGNTGEERARHNLRQSLAKIRQALGEIVVASGDCLSLDHAASETDVGKFLELAGRNDIDALRNSLDLYAGEFLAGLELREAEFSDWLLIVRNRLRQTACDVATRLVDKLVSQGRSGEAIKALDDLLAVDPADENAHRQLMKIYASTGNRSRALRQYQRCQSALEKELGTGPDARTRALCLELQQDTDGVAERTAETAAIARVPIVAVLPFENRSGSDDGYFADGITEDLITTLSCFHTLAVISRGSSFNYRDRTVPEKKIAAELGAQYLVSGSVQRLANRVRINVQLMDADAGLQVWGHRYDREMQDVFALQDEITSTLVSTLAGRVEAARLSHARKAPPERLDAYDLVLRGKDHHHRFTAQDTALCIEMFERAIERDPAYAVAHAWLACGYGLAMVFRLDDIPTLVDKSQAAAEKGLELDENESECHRVLAQVQLTRGNLDRALWHQERALFLNPNDDRILCAQGEILTFVGRADEGLDWVRKSMRLNPYHPQRYWTHLARALFHVGNYEDALSALANITKPRIDDHVYGIVANQMLGNVDASCERVAELMRRFPEFDVSAFIGSQPYTDPAYRQAVAKPLDSAVRQAGK